MQHISRARVLLDQRQYARAEEQLRGAIGEHPQEAVLFAMLGTSLLHLDRFKDAEAAARRSIELEPDSDNSWFVLSLVLSSQGRGRAAIEAAKRAVELDPSDDNNWWVLGIAHLGENELKAALEAAEHGLALNPGDDELLMLRDRALTSLGRPQAVENARHTLSRDPESEVAHDNLGWALLHSGQHAEAIQHFREALRLDPDFDHPREGIIEALKARSWLYRLVLRYNLWLRRYSQRTQWTAIVVFVVVMMLSRRMISWTPQLAPAIHVLRGLIFTACFLLMFAEPLFNLVLRFDPIGKYALKRWKSRMSVVLGIVIVPTAVATVGAALTQGRGWNRLMLVFLILAFGVAILSDIDEKEHERLAVIVLGVIGAFAGVMLVNYFVVPLGIPGLFNAYLTTGFLGAGGLWFWSTFGARSGK